VVPQGEHRFSFLRPVEGQNWAKRLQELRNAHGNKILRRSGISPVGRNNERVAAFGKMTCHRTLPSDLGPNNYAAL
jgi:G3E family GTPase